MDKKTKHITLVEELFGKLAALPQVEAIALGGSRAGENYDEKSDYDVYVYITGQIPTEIRENILSGSCGVMELGNHFWEYEDNCTLKNEIDIDILWRNLDDFVQGISWVVDSCNASNCYTTCMWHNLRTCKILYDRDGRLTAAQKKYSCEYPEKLRKNIITRNMRLLRYSLPAYETQIRKAVKRKDRVSINHRVTEFLASYFDIIFALNKKTHPGEKRLMELSRKWCDVLPANFEENLNCLFNDMSADTKKVVEDIDRIISELEKIDYIRVLPMVSEK